MAYIKLSVFLFGIGTVIPFSNKCIWCFKRNSYETLLNFKSIKWVLDELAMVKVGKVQVPLATLGS